MANFKKAYIEKHKAAIQKDLGLSNVMEIPKMEKMTVNMGLGEAVQNSNIQQLSSPYIKLYPRPWLINERTSRLLSTNNEHDSGVIPRLPNSQRWTIPKCHP